MKIKIGDNFEIDEMGNMKICGEVSSNNISNEHSNFWFLSSCIEFDKIGNVKLYNGKIMQ